MTASARRNLGLVAIVGAALMVIGSFLPWFKVDATFTTITRTGMDDNIGWVTIIFGVAAAGIAAQIIRGRGVGGGVRWNVGLIIIAALSGVLAAVVWAGGTSASKSISDQSFGFVTAKYSTGLYVIALGIACVIAAAAGLEIVRQRTVDAAARSAATPPAPAYSPPPPAYSPTAPTYTAPAAASAPAPAPASKYCPSCGQSIPADAVFCSYCGRNTTVSSPAG